MKRKRFGETFDKVRPIPFSYPMNPGVIAVSGVQTGLVVAYGSGKNVVIMLNGELLVAILKGHQHRVVSISFELHGTNIISCDSSGALIFWHYQDNVWEFAKKVQIDSPATSVTHCSFRRILAYSNKTGLHMCSIGEIAQNEKILAKRSKFCSFNNNGSLLAAHNNSNYVNIFDVLKSTVSQEIVKLPSKVEMMEFHPREKMMVTLTQDHNIRIFKQFERFTCTSVLTASPTGRFIMYPYIVTDNFFINRPKNEVELGFIVDEKLMYETIQENGRVANEKIDFTKHKTVSSVISINRTNSGKKAIAVEENGIAIYTKHGKALHLFHSAPIIDCVFTESHAFTLDSTGSIIHWHLLNQCRSELISQNAGPITSLEDKVIFFEDGSLIQFDTHKKQYSQIPFPVVTKPIGVFHINRNEFFAVTNQGIVSKDGSKNIAIDKFSVSEEFNGNRMLLTLHNNELTATLIPRFFNIPVEVLNRNNKYKEISAGNIGSFAAATDKSVEIWRCIEGKFEMVKSIDFKADGIYFDNIQSVERVIAFDSTKIISIHVDGTELLEADNTTMIRINPQGDVFVFSGPSFMLYSGMSVFIDPIPNAPSSVKYVPFSASDATVPVRSTKKQRWSLPELGDASGAFMCSPSLLFPLKDYVIEITNQTLFHMLEFESTTHLDSVIPKQVPAIPNQQPIPSAFLSSHPVTEFQASLYSLAKEIAKNEDLDIFAARYLLAVRSSNLPNPVFAIYLAHSSSQSMVINELTSTINTFDIVKFHLPAAVQSDSLLESITMSAVTNTYKESQNIESVAMYYVASNNTNKLSKMYSALNESSKAAFFKKDFSIDRNRKSAIKNAYSSLSKHNYQMAAALFMLGNDFDSMISTITMQMNEPMLALHLLRLRFKDMNHPKITKFIQNVQWQSDLIPIIIKAMMRSNDEAEMIEKALYVERPNMLIYGDIRIHLFSVLYSITRSSKCVSKLSIALMNDGLAPLAKYIMEYSKMNVSMIRSVTKALLSSNSNDSSDSNVEDNEDTDESDEQINFDFGGGGFEDDWESDYSSSSSDSDETDGNKPIMEDNNNKVIKNEQENNASDLSIFDEFIKDSVDNICSLFSQKSKNEIASSIALHFGDISRAYDLANKDTQKMIFEKLSKFVVFSCDRFMYSTPAQVGPIRLFTLIQLMYQMTHSEDFLEDIPMSVRCDNIRDPIFYGLFSIGLWTFSHSLLIHLLELKEERVFTPDDISEPRSFLNADLSVPMFADSVPKLLAQYSTSWAAQAASLDRERILILFLLFRKAARVSDLVKPRMKMLYKTLRHYQVALFTPSMDVPLIEKGAPIALMIMRTHKEEMEYLRKIQCDSLKRITSPSVFRNNIMCISGPRELDLGHEASCMSVSNLSKDSLIVQTESKLFHIKFNPGFISKDNINVIFGISDEECEDVHQIISHPEFDLFVAVSENCAMLFDATQIADGHFCFSSGRINCAAFSPHGSKIAFGTKSLEVLPLNVANEVHLSPLARHFDSEITAIAWLNSDTSLAVSTEDGFIRIISTLNGKETVVSHPRDWGDVVAIQAHIDDGSLVFATDKGVVAVCDIRRNFAIDTILRMGSAVVSLQLLNDTFIVGAENGIISLFSVYSPAKQCTVLAPCKIKSAAACANNLIAISENGTLIIWDSAT